MSKKDDKIDGKIKENQKENPINKYEQQKYKSFFKKVKLSIFNLEEYANMAIEGFKRSFKYLLGLVAIFTAIISLWNIYEIKNTIDDIGKNIDKEFYEIIYNQGELRTVIYNNENENDNIIEENIEKKLNISIKNDSFNFLVNTGDISEETYNSYISEIENGNLDILILKDKLITTNIYSANDNIAYLEYTYEENLDNIGIDSFDKSNLIELLTSNKLYISYIMAFSLIYIYYFIMYTLLILMNVILIMLIGRLTSIFINMKMRYIAIFNMAVYSITLSTVLNILYVITNIVIDFKIQYFDTMYIAIASVYMIASILILKTEFIKRNVELSKVQNIHEELVKDMEEKNKEEEQEKERKNKKESKDEKENQSEDKNKENLSDDKLGKNNA